MFLKCMRDIARPHWYEIILLLKRSVGLSVAELSREMKMSYMGVKQHCIELEKRGYLDTWRRAKDVGRPEKAYRLTEKANGLFPDVGHDLTLDILNTVKSINGESAAEKLLFGYFRKIGEGYEKKLKGETLSERVTSLARLRDRDGRLSTVEEEGTSLCLVEFHNPLSSLAKVYESVPRMEAQMIERLLGVSVSREVEVAAGLTRIVFKIA